MNNYLSQFEFSIITTAISMCFSYYLRANAKTIALWNNFILAAPCFSLVFYLFKSYTASLLYCGLLIYIQHYSLKNGKTSFQVESSFAALYFVLLGATIFASVNSLIPDVNVGGWHDSYAIILKMKQDYIPFLLAVVVCMILYSLNNLFIAENRKSTEIMHENIFSFFLFFALYNLTVTNDIFNTYVWLEIIMIVSVSLFIKNFYISMGSNINERKHLQGSYFSSDITNEVIEFNDSKKTIKSIPSNYIFLNMLLTSFILLSIVLLYRITGSLNLEYILRSYDPSDLYYQMAFCIIYLMLIVKSGLLASLIFMKDIYITSIAPINILIYSVLAKSNIFFLSKLSYDLGCDFNFLFKVIGFCSAFATLCFLQGDRKNALPIICLNSSSLALILNGYSPKQTISYLSHSIVVLSILIFYRNISTNSKNNILDKFARLFIFVNIVSIPPFSSLIIKWLYIKSIILHANYNLIDAMVFTAFILSNIALIKPIFNLTFFKEEGFININKYNIVIIAILSLMNIYIFDQLVYK